MMRHSRTARLPVALPQSPLPVRQVLGLLGVAAIGLFIVLLQRHGQSLTFLIALGIVGALLAIFILHWPEIGLFAVVFSAGFVRVKVGTGTGTPIVASLACATLLCGCWLVHQHLHRLRANFLPPQITVPGLALIFFTFFSLLWGRATMDPRISVPASFIRVQLAAAILTCVCVGLLFVGADLCRRREVRTMITVVIMAVGFIALPFRAFHGGLPLLSVFGMFGLCFVALCWAHALVNRRLPNRLRGLLAVGALGWLAFQFFLQTTWISGWLPAMIAFVAIALLARPRFGAILLLLAVFAVFIFQPYFQGLQVKKEEQGSIGGDFGRIELVQRNLAVLGDHLLFGTGPAGYTLYYLTFVPWEAMSTHDNYIDILAENGIPGLASFIGLLIGLGWIGLQLRPRLEAGPDLATGLAALGVLVGAADAMTYGDWVIPFVYNQTLAGFDHAGYVWLVFALLCGLWAQQHYPSEEQNLARTVTGSSQLVYQAQPAREA